MPDVYASDGHRVLTDIRNVLWWLGNNEYSIASFGGEEHNSGITMKVGGGLRSWIPDSVLEEMMAKGWLTRRPNGGKWNWDLTGMGMREAARVHYGL